MTLSDCPLQIALCQLSFKTSLFQNHGAGKDFAQTAEIALTKILGL